MSAPCVHKGYTVHTQRVDVLTAGPMQDCPTSYGRFYTAALWAERAQGQPTLTVAGLLSSFSNTTVDPLVPIGQLPLAKVVAALQLPGPRVGAKQLVTGCWPTFRRSGSADADCFSPDFVLQWGGLHLQQLLPPESQTWRFVSTLFIHDSLEHFVMSMIMLTRLAFQIERAYGGHRIFAIIMLSGLGGAFTGALFEARCDILVGASGAIFGLIGCFIADLIMNFESIKWPLLKLVMVIFIIIQAGVQAAIATRKVSWPMHAGGFFCGLSLSFVLIPNMYRAMALEAYLPLVTAAAVLVFFFFFPIAIFVSNTPVPNPYCNTLAT